jgi:signal transduction histidine kinase
MMAHSLTIPSSVRKFSIEFALLNYANQQQTRYVYQLEGYDREWKIADTRLRQAIYSNLPSGNYKFHVRATDSYGHTTELSVPLYICILPPWYFSWWAWFIYVVLICGGVWWSVRRYHRSLIIKNRLQMNNIFTNITHELLTPLTVISASVDNLRKEYPGHECEYSVIQENISRLVRLLREILEIRKSQEKKLKLEVSKSDLNAFIGKMCKSILPMAQQRGITLNYLGESTGEILQWFDPDKMDKIVYNLLSNAIKYNR